MLRSRAQRVDRDAYALGSPAAEILKEEGLVPNPCLSQTFTLSLSGRGSDVRNSEERYRVKAERRRAGVVTALNLPGVDLKGTHQYTTEGPLWFQEREAFEAMLSAKDFLPNFTGLGSKRVQRGTLKKDRSVYAMAFGERGWLVVDRGAREETHRGLVGTCPTERRNWHQLRTLLSAEHETGQDGGQVPTGLNLFPPPPALAFNN